MPTKTFSTKGLGRTLTAGAALLGALCAVSGGAFAYSERVKNACKNDYLRFCPNYEVGTPSLRSCMSQAGKTGALTPRCVRALIDAGEVPRKYLKR